MKTPLENAEFQLAFTETNLRYLLGETPLNTALIEYTKQVISSLQSHIEDLKGAKPGEGVTLVYSITTPKGSGPNHLARFWGRNDTEAQAKADAYLAKLPAGHTPAAAVERRLGH